MLKLRALQLKALSSSLEKRFENNIIEHLTEHLPEHLALLGEPVTREVVRHAIDRAQNNRFTSEQAVCLYASLELMLGSGFDTDPQLPWAKTILADKNNGDSAVRIDLLHDSAMNYLDQVAGLHSEHFETSLITILTELSHDLTLCTSKDFSFFMKKLLAKIWRPKYEYSEDSSIDYLIDKGYEFREIRFGDIKSTGLFIVLMFMLGHEFYDDPKLPWARRILGAKSSADGRDIYSPLFDAAMSHFRYWLKCLE